MPRIIIHTPEPKSAAARYVWELARALALSGVDICLVCPENMQFIDELAAYPQITVRPTRARATCAKRNLFTRVWDNLLFLASSLAALLKTARKGDSVHFQFVLHLPFGALFFLATRLLGCKIIFTVHDPMPHRWLLPLSLRWLEHRALAWTYKVSHTLIVHSEPGKNLLVDFFHQEPAKIQVIPHGPYELGCGVMPMMASDMLELLMFGSIRENKGIHLAIEAVQAVNSTGSRVRLTIAGEVMHGGEQEYWQHCLHLINRDPEQIRLMPQFVPDHELPGLFSRSHCVLLPYTDFHSDSGVANMALANGRPILATRSGGLGPLIMQKDVGLPINEISTDGVIEAIASALKMGLPELAHRGTTGAEVVNQHGNAWKRIAEKTITVYREYGVSPEIRQNFSEASANKLQ